METPEKEEEKEETGKVEETDEKKEELTSGGIGNEEKKEAKEKEPNREKMEGRKATDNFLPVGGILRGNPFSCLPPGFGIACSPLQETSQNANMSMEIPTIILERPSQLRGDGRSFLRSTPLHCYVRAGQLGPMKALTDPCSNVGLMDLALFRRGYPEIGIQQNTASVSGVGTNKTFGYAIVPIQFDCVRNGDTREKLQADIEVHLIEDFPPGLVIGLDFLCDYRMELNIAKKIASFPTGHTTRLASPPNKKFRNVKVLCRKRTTVPPRTIKKIEIKASITPGMDYTFSPFTVVEKGMPPSPQMMHAIIDSGTKSMMFSNWSEHPVVIEEDQQLGTAQPVLFGCWFHTTGSYINWDDLSTPGAPAYGSEGLAAIPGEQECYHVELRESRPTSDSTRTPRSIADDEAALISTMAQPRRKGELFPAEDDGDILPETSPFTEGKPMVSPHLSESQRIEISLVLEEFSDCFSDRKSIGHVRGYSVPINTGNNPLPPPQAPRPTGPAMRDAIDTAIEELLNWNVIEPSTSPTASPVLLVWQNNKWRFCVNYHPVNAITILDAYPLLRPDYVFSAMGNKEYFSVFNAVKGYHQVDIDEEDRHKTAFICHCGLFQYKRLPFGLKNAPGQ